MADTASTTSAVAADSPSPTSAPPFIPLEANPELMTALLNRIGLSPDLAVHDVFSLDEPDLLAMIPRPAHALLLVFPVSATYEAHRLAEDALLKDYAGSGDGEPVVWFRQTITNACGLVALLHAACNGEARSRIKENSELQKFLAEAIPLKPDPRARLLESSSALATAHLAAAGQGATGAPPATEDVDLHYVCFVKGSDGTLWELDGRRKGPLARGTLDAGEDALSPRAISLGPKEFLKREDQDLRFSCVALAKADD